MKSTRHSMEKVRQNYECDLSYIRIMQIGNEASNLDKEKLNRVLRQNTCTLIPGLKLRCNKICSLNVYRVSAAMSSTDLFGF